MKTWVTWMAVASFAASAHGAESELPWPQFRGPGGSGVAQDAKPPVEIGPDKNVLWKVPVPSGLSSPIVVGDKLVITALDDGKLYTIALDRATGREAWRAEAPAQKLEAYHKTEGSPAASTPATDGERVVSYFGSCGLFCYDLQGRELWRFETPPANVPGNFGSGVSPIVADGLVILVRDQATDAKIVAFDAATGALQWQRPRQSPVSYCTPVVWNSPDGKQIVAAGHARMVGYDLKSGAESWTFVGLPYGCCSSPVVDGDVVYFAGTGSSEDPDSKMPAFDGLLKDLDADKDGALSRAEAAASFQGFFDNQDVNQDGKITRDEWDTILKFMSEGKSAAFALRAGGSGDVTSSHLIWKQTRGLPYVASAIAYRGQYVMVKDGGIVTAYDTHSGTEVYQQRAAASGSYYASPVAANGHIYFVNLDGAVTVIQAGLPEPKVVSSGASLGERTAATPAIADDTLYVRTETSLYAFTEKK